MSNRERFACPCGCGENLIDPRIVSLVDWVETGAGKKFTVASGHRCEKHNKEVGGSDTSSHLKGLAVDIECSTSRDRWYVIEGMIRAGVRRIGIGKTFVHIDIDRAKDARVIWMY